MSGTAAGDRQARRPYSVWRPSARLGAILAGYPDVWALPPLAVFALPLSLGVGLLLGASDSAIYASSLLTTAILAACAGLGAAVGLSAWLGFVLGDLFLRDPAHAHIWGSASPPAGFTQLYGPLLISYLLLAGLLVMSPALAARLRAITAQLFRSTRVLGRTPDRLAAVAGAAVLVGIQLLYATAWIRATEVLILPLFKYRARIPERANTHALHAHGLIIIVVTGVAVAVGALLSFTAGRRRAAKPDVATTRRSRRLPLMFLIPLQAALFTLVLSGLVSNAAYAVGLAVALVVLLFLRTAGFPRLTAAVAALRRIPLLIRLALYALLSYFLVVRLLAPAWHGKWFSPVIITITASLLLGGLLLSPEKRRHREGRTSGTVPPAMSAGVTAAVLLVLVLMINATSGIAAGIPWWKLQSSRSGQTTGSFSWSGSATGSFSRAQIECSYRTGDPTHGYADFFLQGGNFAWVGYGPKPGTGTVFIEVLEATRPGAYPTGDLTYFRTNEEPLLGDWDPSHGPTAEVGFGVAEKVTFYNATAGRIVSGGFESDWSSVPGSAPGTQSSHGTVTLAADGSGSLTATLDNFSTGDLLNVRGSWSACAVRQASGYSPPGPTFIPTLPTKAVEAAAIHDANAGVLVPILGLLIFAPELLGLGGAAGGAGAADLGAAGLLDDAGGAVVSDSAGAMGTAAGGVDTSADDLKIALDDPRVGDLVQGYDPYGNLTRDQFYEKWWDPEAQGGKGGWAWNRLPPNGAEPGTEIPLELQPGQIMDQVGTDGGHYFSPSGTPYAQRSLPPTSLVSSEGGAGYHVFRVLKPLPVDAAKIARGFEQPGGGWQFKADQSIAWLKTNGYIEEIIPGPAG